jgi:hypothetical protein
MRVSDDNFENYFFFFGLGSTFEIFFVNKAQSYAPLFKPFFFFLLQEIIPNEVFMLFFFSLKLLIYIYFK